MFGKLFEPRIRRMKRTAADLVAGLDDRSRLLALELGTESRWLAKLVGTSLAAGVIAIICLVWLMATLVALTWDTPFWILLSLVLVLRIRSLLKDHPEPFPLSRQVLADDLRSLKDDLERERNSES
mgnify:CR=1 FL=1